MVAIRQTGGVEDETMREDTIPFTPSFSRKLLNSSTLFGSAQERNVSYIPSLYDGNCTHLLNTL